MTSTSTTLRENRYNAPMAGHEGRALHGMWFRLIFFLLPILLLLGPFIYAVDPYDLFRHRSVIPERIRSSYGHRVNEVLWKMIEYDRNPMPNIMLGDSQMAGLPAAAVSSITGEPYANMAYAGGTLRESIDTFRYASRITRLRRVYFGLDFMAYTAKLDDRVPQAEEILRNPLAYFMNSDVVEASFYDVADSVFHHQTGFEPKMSKEAFWKDQIQYLAGRYKRDADPGLLKDELKKIISYCQSRNIRFAFLITPQSMDAQRQVKILGVENQYRQFKEDLNGMAPVYDCDFENSLTSDPNNFRDPFHMEPFAVDRLVADLWSGHPSLCRTPAS